MDGRECERVGRVAPTCQRIGRIAQVDDLAEVPKTPSRESDDGIVRAALHKGCDIVCLFVVAPKLASANETAGIPWYGRVTQILRIEARIQVRRG